MASEKTRGNAQRGPTERRRRSVEVRVTDAELTLLDRVAGRLGANRSAAIRAAVDAYDAATDGRRTRRETLGPETRKVLARLTSEVNRVGVNINQISRSLNGAKGFLADRLLYTDASPVLGQTMTGNAVRDRAVAREKRRMGELEILIEEFRKLREALSELTAMINDMRASETESEDAS